jgi:hypothetical protein
MIDIYLQPHADAWTEDLADEDRRCVDANALESARQLLREQLPPTPRWLLSRALRQASRV